MTLSLRRRIVLTLVPLLVLIAGLGAAGAVLLYRLGSRIDLILRENYVSVQAMERLNEALERIDSSFQFALVGQEAEARKSYAENWDAFREQLAIERDNITVYPEEPELVRRLEDLTERYRTRGDRFFAHPANSGERRLDYFGRPDTVSLLDLFREIKVVAADILRLNQHSMEQASRDAKELARLSLTGFGVGLAAAAAIAVLLAWRVVHSILGPVQAITDAALAIGAGNLHQQVPVLSRDELGQLAGAFNRMAAQLRDYRQSQSARLLRAQRTAQATIDSFTDPVLVVEPGGHVELANPAARRLLGVAPGERGEPSAQPWQPPEALRAALDAALLHQAAYATQSFTQSVTFRLDGADHSYLPQILPISDPYGFAMGAAVVLNDVTRYRLLDQLKSDLVATVSHELKTPLTSVRLVLHLLLEETVGPLTSKQTELLLDARDNAERLLGMIENLLALARLEQGREPLTPIAVAPGDLLRAAAELARPRAEAKRIVVEVEADEAPMVRADPHRFGHALGNLVENALTYTEDGGKVTLGARADGADRVVLTVSDTGVGIPADYLPHVFDRFFRVPGQSRGQGTGLGLAIVREIVAAHGGTVACASEPGRGTTFTITLAAAASLSAPAAGSSEGGGP